MTAMPWFRLYRDIASSPKLFELEERIGEAALAHLVKFWCAVAAHRSDGLLNGLSEAAIERWADWRGARGAFVAALRETGFLEGTTVRGWAERQEAQVAKFERDNSRPNAKARGEEKAPAEPHGGHSEIPVRGPVRERRGEESREEEKRGEGPEAAPAAPPKVNRGRQNPSAPAPLPGRIGASGVGFMENPADFPKTVEDLLERHGADLAKAFPMLDGKSPRPSIEDAVRAKWDWYLTSRGKHGGGHANAMSVLKVDLGKIAREHTYGWEKDRSTTVESRASAITREKVLKPIEEHPHDLDGPVDISALMAKVTSAKVKPPTRASGGEMPSGGLT